MHETFAHFVSIDVGMEIPELEIVP